MVVNNRGSARMGTSPSRCANTSSAMIDVFWYRYTFSIAMVGICMCLWRPGPR